MLHALTNTFAIIYNTPQVAEQTTAQPQVPAAILGILLIGLIVFLLFLILSLVGLWKLYTKAGQPGWAAIVPIYNIYVLLQIAERPGWWTLLFFVPIVNVCLAFVVAVDIAKAFGKSTAFGIVALGIFSTIGYLILGFGSAKYQGNAVGTTTMQDPPLPPVVPTPPANPMA